VTRSSSKISSFLLLSRRVYPAVLCKYLIYAVRSLFLSYSLIIRISLPYRRVERPNVLCNFNLVLLWTKFGFSVLFKSPSICKNFVILECMCFSSWYEMLQPRYVKVFICSNIMLSITIFLRIGSFPLKALKKRRNLNYEHRTFFILFFNARQPTSGPGLFNSSSPDIPIPCPSPPSSYVQQQQRVPPDVAFPPQSWSSHKSSSMKFFIQYFLGILELSIRTIWPAHCNLLNLINFTMSGPFNSSYSSLLS
jgi:hypothetical protein